MNTTKQIIQEEFDNVSKQILTENSDPNHFYINGLDSSDISDEAAELIENICKNFDLKCDIDWEKERIVIAKTSEGLAAGIAEADEYAEDPGPITATGPFR